MAKSALNILTGEALPLIIGVWDETTHLYFPEGRRLADHSP